MAHLTPGMSRFKPLGLLKMGRYSTVSLVLELASNEKRVARWFDLPEGVSEVDLLQAIEREARALKELPKINVPRFDRVVEGDGGTWMLFEWVEGRPLSHYQSVESGISGPWIVWWLHQILTILNALHTRPVPFVVGYLDPSDILVVEDRVVLADLGIFEDLCPEAGASLLQKHMYAPFIAPERRNAVETAPTADLYSAAALAFWLWTGYSPVVTGPAAQAHMLAALRQYRQDMPPEVSQLLSDMLDFDPQKRPATARRALDRLIPFVISMRGESPPPACQLETYKFAAEVTRIEKPMQPIFDPTASQETGAVPPLRARPPQPPPAKPRLSRSEAIRAQVQAHPVGTAVAAVALGGLLLAGGIEVQRLASDSAASATVSPGLQVVTGRVASRQTPGGSWTTVGTVLPGADVWAGSTGAQLSAASTSIWLRGETKATLVSVAPTELSMQLTDGWLKLKTGSGHGVVTVPGGSVAVDPSTEMTVSLGADGCKVTCLEGGVVLSGGTKGQRRLTAGGADSF